MNIDTFKEITTEQHLEKLEAEAEKYDGLYVDMEKIEQRKYVKQNLIVIDGLIKSIDRARIDKTRAFKAAIDNEADHIKERLRGANKPFSLLLDDYKEKRQLVLNAEKAEKAAAALVVQIETDHNDALLLNKVFAFEKAEKLAAQEKRDEQIRQEAAENATLIADQAAKQAADRLERERSQKEADKKAEAQRRENDMSHKGAINRGIVDDLIPLGLSVADCKKVVSAIAKGSIKNVTIIY